MTKPRINKTPSCYTPERAALLRELYPTYMSTRAIKAQLDALPGIPIAARKVHIYANNMGLRRPKDFRYGRPQHSGATPTGPINTAVWDIEPVKTDKEPVAAVSTQMLMSEAIEAVTAPATIDVVETWAQQHTDLPHCKLDAAQFKRINAERRNCGLPAFRLSREILPRAREKTDDCR
jgi:hypothetical protein